MAELVELIGRRRENSKTFDLGNGKRGLDVSIGAVHYKDNYADDKEQWKDIDLTWDGKHLFTAPYELTVDDKKLIFKDKKTGEVSTLELISVKPSGLALEVIPSNEGVSFQHILPSDKIPFEAQFKLTGRARLITRAFDDAGELEIETSFKDGILTERLSKVKDKATGQPRQTKGNIRIDPTLTVQPPGKDNCLWQGGPTTNYGSDASPSLYDVENLCTRFLLEFDISGLPADATLTLATLYLKYYAYALTDPVGKTVWAYKLSRTDWVELESTWNIYKTGSNWTAAGGDYVTSNPAGGSTTVPASYGWMTWNVLAIVQDAYDSSIAAEFLVKFENDQLAANGQSLAYFRFKEYATEADRPKLYIEYSVAYTRAASVLIGNKVAASRTLAIDRDSSTIIGNLVSASRAYAGNRTSAIITGVVASTVLRSWGRIRQTSTIVGNLVTATRGILTATRTSSTIVGVVPSATRTLTMTKIPSLLLVGVVTTASRLPSYIRTASKVIGVKVTTARTYLTFHRASSVIIGAVVTAIVQAGVQRAIVYIGVKVTATRNITKVLATASFVIGIVATASRVAGYIRTASTIIGDVVTAIHPPWARTRASSVIVGEVTTASRVVTATRVGSVLLGISITASRSITVTRKAAVKVGIVVSAFIRIIGRVLYIKVITAQYRQVNVITAMYRKIRSITTGGQ